ncbi:MAG: hypothetical protein DRP51_03560 [Candidatus Zixiibacteriota bacterium]|nr:MAG: hypothetical protein DRP51_03560 [candidate division Zixibacteria bacterium]HHI02738.1 hypothetical protein [candidate division Zixibacteria bacterium]
MLRRNFIKSAFVAIGGVLVIGRVPMADTFEKVNSGYLVGRLSKPRLTLHGHRRSGCATRPELAAVFEDGCGVLPS